MTHSLWEPFTERARRAVILAQDEARKLGNNYVGTEHLLLGLLNEGENAAARVLESFGVTLVKARSECEEIVGRGVHSPQNEMVFTPRAKHVFERAGEESVALAVNYIGCEHILLALLGDNEGVAARLLVKMQIDPAALREKLVKVAGGMPNDIAKVRHTIATLATRVRRGEATATEIFTELERQADILQRHEKSAAA